jgi:hypothetical protein
MLIQTSGTAYLLSQLCGGGQHQSLGPILQDKDGKHGSLARAWVMTLQPVKGKSKRDSGSELKSCFVR